MLVKIIAAGLTPAEWREALQQLRSVLPEQPFSVGLFTSEDELTYLCGDFFPRQFAREAPDFLLCPAPPQAPWPTELEFLRRVQALPKAPLKVLAFHGLERSLKALIAAHGGLELSLDTGNICAVSDPAVLAASFPPDFPRIRVDDQLSALVLRGETPEIDPGSLADGTVLAFSQLQAILRRNERLSPKGWLKDVLAGANARRSPHAVGLIKEAQGLFLFPGVPLPHVCGVTIAGVHFPLLLDLEQMLPEVPQFAAFAAAVRDVGRRRLRAWKSHTARIRQAEAKSDIPIVCAGAVELLRESLAALLTRQGHHRCFTLATPAEGVLREPSLLLQVSPWKKGRLGAQTAAPVVIDIGEELDERMKPLDSMLPWRKLKFETPPVDIPPLPRDQFAQQRKRLSARAVRIDKRAGLLEKRALLMDQEVQVLQAAQQKLAALLDSEQTIQVWSGEALPVNQLLLFSYDQEEAALVMQALPHITKKRWFDLTPFADADSMQNLDLDLMRSYAENGAIRITPAARERLRAQRESSRAELDHAAETLSAARGELEQLQGERRDVEAAQQKLARQWVWEALGQWLKDNRSRMAGALETLREKQENRWFNRSHVRRALILPGQQENGAALLEACESVYPGFSRDLSIVVPYEYDTLEALPSEEAARIQEQGRAEGLAAGGVAARMEQALNAKNEAQFADFLQLISSELTGLRTDLVLIEHRPEIAPRILEHLRRAAPKLKDVPAVLILSGLWSPPANKPLPWPRTRIALLPRLGALTTEDCREHLLALYSS